MNNPFHYHLDAHTVLVGCAMAAAAILYTYAISYVWAKWRQGRQEREGLRCATCSRPAEEFGRLDNEVGSTAFFCASCADTATNYRYVGML